MPADKPDEKLHKLIMDDSEIVLDEVDQLKAIGVKRESLAHGKTIMYT